MLGGADGRRRQRCALIIGAIACLFLSLACCNVVFPQALPCKPRDQCERMVGGLKGNEQWKWGHNLTLKAEAQRDKGPHQTKMSSLAEHQECWRAGKMGQQNHDERDEGVRAAKKHDAKTGRFETKMQKYSERKYTSGVRLRKYCRALRRHSNV